MKIIIIEDEVKAAKSLAAMIAKVKPEAEIIAQLQTAGAEAIVLANTELPLLIQPDSSPVRFFDTMAIHAIRAVEVALLT